jgi:hypothetical protein
MTARDCQSCHHCHKVTLHLATPVREELRCFRIRRHRDTRSPGKGVVHPGVEGFPVWSERDVVPEPHRVPGDKCGPDGTHWMARAK